MRLVPTPTKKQLSVIHKIVNSNLAVRIRELTPDWHIQLGTQMVMIPKGFQLDWASVSIELFGLP